MGLSIESLRKIKLIAGFYDIEVTKLGQRVLNRVDRNLILSALSQ